MREDNFKRFVPPKSNSADVALDNEILRVLVGSSLTGITGADNTQDWDINAIFIEPKEYVIGFRKKDDYTYRTQPEGVRRQPGDIDFTSYSLRKFLYLALKGNPSILMLLFAPGSHVAYINQFGWELRELSQHIASKKAGTPFLGYLESQEKRLVGELKGHMPKRPELIEKYGYDTKYAAHALRLGYQGIEYMETGRMNLPMLADPGNHLRDVRAGLFTLEQVVEELMNVKAELKTAIDNSPLPEEPDYQTIEYWMIGVHEDHWKSKRQK